MKKFPAVVMAAILTLGCINFSITVGAEPYTTDSEGYDVYEIQYILKKYGYFTNDCTGYYGEATGNAVKAFQTDKGLSATGTADEDTVAAIRAAGCTDAVVTVKSQLNVREQPEQDSTPIDSLTRDSNVYIYSEKDDWYHIETENGNLGFVLKKYLAPGKMSGIAGTITGVSDDVNARKKADISADVAFKVSNNSEVWVIGGQGDWFEIEYDGKTGYIFKKYVSIGAEGGSATTISELFDAWKGSVTTDVLRVRSGPSTGYDAITSLTKGNTVTVLGESGNWYYIQLSGGTKGYASKDYIQKGSGSSTCTVTADSLKVRKGPGTEYSEIASVKSGDVLTLVDDSGEWYKIKTSSGTTGYVNGKYVKLGGSLSSNTSAGTAPSGTFKSGSEGSDVTKIQNRLKVLGYFSGTATGYYGSATITAVKKFQSANSLSSDGICGSSTLKKMFSSSAVTASAAKSESSSKSSESSSSSNSDSTATSNSGSSTGQQIAAYAKQFLGKPYVTAANGPNAFDCSGFTKYVYAHFGISLPRTAYEQGYNGPGTKVTNVSDLQVGDLVFFNTISDSDLSDHATIYIGNGQIIHASSGSSRCVVISSLSQSYYKTHYSWGRHVV